MASVGKRPERSARAEARGPAGPARPGRASAVTPVSPAKLTGPAVEAGQDLRASAADAWWLAQAPEKAVVFALHITQAVFIDWDIKRGLMTVHRWSPVSGYAVASRPDP
jgi:hypothetical protein